MSRAPLPFPGAVDSCIAPMIRKPVRATPTPPAELLLRRAPGYWFATDWIVSSPTWTSVARTGLVGFGMNADCENAALSSSHVGDAVPARAVEARALSGP
jgi:hypothetical protein